MNSNPLPNWIWISFKCLLIEFSVIESQTQLNLNSIQVSCNNVIFNILNLNFPIIFPFCPSFKGSVVLKRKRSENNKRRQFCTIACSLSKDLAVCFRLEMANWGDWRICSCIFCCCKTSPQQNKCFLYQGFFWVRRTRDSETWWWSWWIEAIWGFSAVSNLQLKNPGFTAFGKCALPSPSSCLPGSLLNSFGFRVVGVTVADSFK